MADSEKKPVLNLVPAILTGTAALLAALTTLYVNLRNDLNPAPAAAPVPVAAPHTSVQAPEPPTPAQPQVLCLQLQRISVQQDGAVGSADWRFAVEADGDPLFTLEQEGLNAKGGRNIVVVDQARQARVALELPPGKTMTITIKGWRSGWFKSGDEPLVVGEGTLAAAGALAPIKAQAADPGKGAFTFYFTANAVRD
ncbi:MAG TPA: hypothetical protein VK325_12090 [Pseudoxanthomonas sp.]|nr:hypothetical protein [Pseudoxanthomonas sp.]